MALSNRLAKDQATETVIQKKEKKRKEKPPVSVIGISLFDTPSLNDAR